MSSRRRQVSVWALNSKHMQLIPKYKTQNTKTKINENVIKNTKCPRGGDMCLSERWIQNTCNWYKDWPSIWSNPLKNTHTNSFKTTIQEQVALNKRQQPKTWISNTYFHFLFCSISKPIYSFQQQILWYVLQSSKALKQLKQLKQQSSKVIKSSCVEQLNERKHKYQLRRRILKGTRCTIVQVSAAKKSIKRDRLYSSSSRIQAAGHVSSTYWNTRRWCSNSCDLALIDANTSCDEGPLALAISLEITLWKQNQYS